MALKSPKKGPHRVTTAKKARTSEDVDRQALESEVDTFIRKVHNTIQDARAKMSDEEVEKADKEADAILKNASAAAKASRNSA